MNRKDSLRIHFNFRFLRHCFLLLIAILLLGTCEKEPQPGSLHLTFEDEYYSTSVVECLLHKFQSDKYLKKFCQGEVLFENLEAGWYYISAHRAWTNNLSLWADDSVEIEAGKRTNKLIYLFPSPI